MGLSIFSSCSSLKKILFKKFEKNSPLRYHVWILQHSWVVFIVGSVSDGKRLCSETDLRGPQKPKKEVSLP